MRYRNAFIEGFNLINRNWQIVAIRVLVMVINIACFFLFVGVPVFITLVVMGIDIGEISNLQAIPENILDFLTKYFVLILIALAFLLIYLLIITILVIFMYGASSGTLVYGIIKTSENFSLKRFFSEGKRIFAPMVRFLTAAGLIMIVVAVIISLIFISVISLSEYFKQANTVIGLFSGMFLMVFAIAVSLFLITAVLALTFYGTAILLFSGKGAIASLKEASVYLYDRQSAYWLYCILLGLSLVLMLLLMVLGIPLNMIPVIGSILSIPYQIITFVIQSYFGYFTLSVIFTYYYHTANATGSPSVEEKNISFSKSPGQDGPLPL